MNSWKLMLRGLKHHWRIQLAVALGVTAGAAVLTGALLVGDSVRGSLRALTLDRLGRIDEALVTPVFFRQRLAAELAGDSEFQKHFSQAIPAIVLRASLSNAELQNTVAADASPSTSAISVKGFSGRVTLLAVDRRFWQAGDGGPKTIPRDEVGDDFPDMVLNEPLAKELNAKVGDEVLLRLPDVSLVPRESTLGKKKQYMQTQRFTIVEIIPATGLGRFGMHPNQQLPFNAFASLVSVQKMLGVNKTKRKQETPAKLGRINAIIITGKQQPGAHPPAKSQGVLNRLIRPRLADYGVKLELAHYGEKLERTERVANSYFNLTTDRMLLDGPVEEAAWSVFKPLGGQRTLTYLANYIAAGKPLTPEEEQKLKPEDKRPVAIPYSIVTALDFGDEDRPRQFGRWESVLEDTRETIHSLKENEIALNVWAFENLNKYLQASGQPALKRGDEIRLTFFEPEHTAGKSSERTVAFKLRAVFPLDANSPARDPNFTPVVPGVTDKESIDDWKAPFEYYSSRLRRPDDDIYWTKHKATPKAFVSLETGQELWGTRRFGRLTSIRIPTSEGRTEESLAAVLEKKIDPQKMGFAFQPLKQLGLEAASGTTPFSVLFVIFSFFIIAAAVMLVALLFRLGVESRAEEIGTLLAAGFTPRKVRRLLAGEGLIIAAVGGLLGTVTGAGYAALILYGLRNWWVGAVSTPFLQLHVSWLSFALGYISSVIVCFAAVWWTLWQMRKLSVRRLLAGQAAEECDLDVSRPRVSRWVAAVSLSAAAILVLVSLTVGGEWQTLAFFGSGFAVLTGLLALLWGMLRSGATGQLISSGGFPLLRLAIRNGARNPSRSTLTIGLVASATFIVVALSVFRVDPSQQGPDINSGNGGFALIAESGSPIVIDIDDKSKIDIQPDQRQELKDVKIYSLRVQPGEDASCRNLYQTKRPRVLGVPDNLIERGGFAWSGTAADTEKEMENPWLLLKKDAGKTEDGEDFIPFVLDMNTAMYSLHLSVGHTFTMQDDWGRDVHLKLVGMLKNSIFQGDVLMSEDHLLSRFPDVSGSSFFLVEVTGEAGAADDQTAPAKLETIQRILESGLKESGFDAQSTGERLAGFMAVQNAYLLTFQSLGALGLLLGTFGLATVQLRNVLERRGELALLRAAGFRRRRLAELVMAENSLLLSGGLAIGTLAALVAVSPHLIGGGAHIPVLELAVAVAGIFAVGFTAGLAAVWATLKAPLIQALRGD